MALLTWDSSYSVGVKALDDQHTVLFSILNDLHAAMMKGQAQNVTGALLRKLVQYTREHFTSEEAKMAALGYPGLAAHRTVHSNLTKQVEEYAAKFEKGETAISIELLTFLRDWLTNHIQRTDKEYGPWMNEHGVH
jgi:hemerythrin-like metal-binding protein